MQASSETPAVTVTDDMVQVINGGGDFVAEGDASLRNFLAEKKDFITRGLDYSVVAVLGAQSSGKSTLLNLLFGMQFQVLSAELGRERTTHGVWLGVAPRAPQGMPGSLLVLDVEGTDGSCRQDELGFERKTSLFSLAVASVLIVNIWYQDIGRYNAANLALLKTVFEIDLQLFATPTKATAAAEAQDSTSSTSTPSTAAETHSESSPSQQKQQQQPQRQKTLILFVIRDHLTTPLPKLEQLLRRSLDDIWEGLTKPKGLENSTLGDMFDLAFAALPHMLLAREAFDTGVDALRERFLDPECPSGWLLDPSHRRDIPTDGFATFAEKIWEVIKTNKDLDLPSQKHMLATYRCEEIAEEAYKAFVAEIAPLAEALELRAEVCEKFGERAEFAFEHWHNAYAEPASRYLAEVSQHKGEDLDARMHTELGRLFMLQLGLGSARTLGRLDAGLAAVLAELRSVPSPDDNRCLEFGTRLRRAASDAQEEFRGIVQSSLVPGVAWPHEIEASKLSASMDQRVRTARRDAIAHIEAAIKAELREKLEAELLPLLDKARSRMWAEVRELLADVDALGDERVSKRLEHPFAADKDEAVALCEGVRDATREHLHACLHEKIKFMSFLMEKRFHTMFSTDAKGLPRRWTGRDDVPVAFLRARDAAEMLIDLYGYMRLDEADDSITFFETEEAASAAAAAGSSADQPQHAQRVLLGRPRSVGLPTPVPVLKERVLATPDECRMALEQFRRKAEVEYMQALRDQERVTSSMHLPLWVIGLLLFLGWDEVLYVLKNPLLVLSLALVAALGFVLWKLNLGGVVAKTMQLFATASFGTLRDHVLDYVRRYDQSRQQQQPNVVPAQSPSPPPGGMVPVLLQDQAETAAYRHRRSAASSASEPSSSS